MQPDKPSFSIWPWSWLVLLPLLASQCLVTNWMHPEPIPIETLSGMISGGMVATLLIALGLAWVVWRISGRNRMAGNIVFLLVALGLCMLQTMGVGAVALARHIDDRNKKAAEITAAAAEMKDTVRRSNNSTNDGNFNAIDEAGKKLNDKLRAAADGASSEEKAVLEVSVAFLESFGKERSKFHASLQKLYVAKVLEPGSLKDREMIRRNITILDDFLAQCENLKVTAANSPAFIEAELAKKDALSPRLQESAKKSLLDQFSKKPLKELIEVETAIGQTTKSMLEYLDKSWGQWSINSENELIFQKEATREEYNALFEQLQKNIARETEVQAKMSK